MDFANLYHLLFKSTTKMKSVQLTRINTRDRKHEVFLGNGSRTVFGNKKEAKKFLADASRFMTKKLVDLNEIYSRVFVEYRQLWFLLSNHKGTKTNYLQEERAIKDGLDTVNHFFDKVANNRGFSDYTVFIDARKICLFLSETIKALVYLNKRRNNTVTYYSLENLLTRCTELATEINNYGGKVLEHELKKPVIEITGQTKTNCL